MPKFRKKPVVIEAITFQEFIEYGRSNGANIVGGMPWSFNYNGHQVTHENDECYLIPTLEGTHNFTPLDMLITGVKGEIYPCKIDIFEKTYEAVPEKKLYYQLSDGADVSKAVMELSGAMTWIEEGMKEFSSDMRQDELPEYTLTPVWMTDEEFNNLPEGEF